MIPKFGNIVHYKQFSSSRACMFSTHSRRLDIRYSARSTNE
jgi:hypothetical protein